MKIAHWMPGLGTLATYKASFLPHDLAAGLTLGAVMVPVGLAYGELAGLPLAGLYGSMLPLLAYALFGSWPSSWCRWRRATPADWRCWPRGSA